MTKKIYLIVFLLILLLPKESVPISREETTNSEKLRVFIQMEKFTFFTDEKVKVKIHIKNTSYEEVQLNIYDLLFTTFQPLVFDRYGREAENIVPYRMMNQNMSSILQSHKPRVILLSPRDTFIHSINLKEMYKLYTDREYRVKGFFLPDATTPKAIAGENVLSFKIVELGKPIQKSGVKRVKRAISPSEIVLLFLNSEKEKNWNNYLKYIKIKSYINSYSNFVKGYNSADEKEKLNIEEDFIKFLSRDRIDYIINFKILSENITEEGKAYVEALVKRFDRRMPVLYKYKYTLERYKELWLLTDVEATVVKGGIK